MSQLPDDQLRRILGQIQENAQQASRNLSLSRAQISQKEREKRILQLTIEELGSLPKKEDIKMYKGVGKMFMNVPRVTMEKDLAKQEADLTDDINNLSKKSKYLEKQFLEANAQLRDIFNSRERDS